MHLLYFMNRKMFSLLLFFLPFCVLGQKEGQALIDSLLTELPKQKEDTIKVKVLYRLSGLYSTVDIDKGLQYGKNALLLAKKLNWETGVIKSSNSLGLNFWRKGDYPEALNYFDTVILVSMQTGDKIMLNKGSLNKGSVYNLQGYYPRALEYYMKCLKVSEDIRDYPDEALCLHNIASVYLKTDDYAKALDYDTKAFALYQSLANKYGMAQCLGGQADAYDGLKKDTETLHYYQKALTLYEELNDKNGMAAMLNDMATTYKDKKDFKNSVADYAKAIAIEDSLGNDYELGMLYNNIAGVYIDAVRFGDYSTNENNNIGIVNIKTGYLKKANDYLSGALIINKKNKNFDALMDNYLFISELDSINGDYKGALEMHKKYSIYNDSIYNTNNKQTIQQLEAQRQIDLRDKEIQISKLTISNGEKQRWLYIAGLVLLFIIGGLLFLRSRNRKKVNIRLQNLNSRLDEANKIKTRFFAILSHDLRSPVASLINFLYLQKEAPDLLEKTDPLIHKQRITNSAQDLLNIMEDLLLWSKGQMNNFKPEITRVQVTNLFNEMQHTYPGTKELQINFVTPPGDLVIDTDENYLKTILRNLTTNAIKALKNKINGYIEWKAWQEGGKIYLSITDNGPGISEAQQQVLFTNDASIGTRNGLGLHLIRDLATALSYSIKVDSQLEKGTTFILMAC